MTVKHIFMTNKLLEKVNKIIKIDFTEIKNKLSKHQINFLKTGELTKIGNGIEAFTINKIPDSVVKTANKIFKVNSVYSIGLISEGKLYGDISIILREGKDIVNMKNLVQLYAQLASIAIQRSIALNDLIALEQQNTLIVNNLGEGIGIVNDKEEFIYANPSAEEIFGVEPGTLTTKKLHDFISPEDASKITNRSDNKIGLDIISNNELKIRRPNGDIRLLDISTSLLPNYKGTKNRYLGIFRDNTEKILSEQRIRKTLAEKEILLKEVFHRVKNNLQIISSILRMQVQLANNDAVKSKLQRSLDRIYSMSLIQSKLFQSNDLENINLPTYINSIVTNLISSYHFQPGKIKVKYYVSDIEIDINMATPFGLLVSEIISNVFEHAFPDDAKGVINISVNISNSIFKLSISDNGIGIDDNIDIKSSKSVGFLLIQSLVTQLKGDLQIIKNNGTEVIITFKESKLKTYSKIR